MGRRQRLLHGSTVEGAVTDEGVVKYMGVSPEDAQQGSREGRMEPGAQH